MRGNNQGRYVSPTLWEPPLLLRETTMDKTESSKAGEKRTTGDNQALAFKPGLKKKFDLLAFFGGGGIDLGQPIIAGGKIT